MARNPNTETRRSQIVAAMLPVIAKHGYDKATVQAIAAEAGLAPGLIHYHFKTKREILVSLVQSMAEVARARYERALVTAEGPAGRLQAYLHARLGLGEGAAPDMVAAWVMIGAEAVRQAEVREIYQQLVADELALITELLHDCLREQGRDARGARTLAAGLLALMEGAFQLSSAAPAAMPAGYAAHAAIALATLSVAAAPMAKPRTT